jgi:Rrf2 family protein
MISMSKTTGYAIAAMSCLDGQGGRPVSVHDVAECTNISRSYLSKIIQILADKNLVKTKRGYTGGLLLTQAPEEISLLEVVLAIEGSQWIGDCLLRLEGCNGSCPTHAFWDEEKKRIEDELRTRKLIEVTQFKNCNSKRINGFSHHLEPEETGGSR